MEVIKPRSKGFLTRFDADERSLERERKFYSNFILSLSLSSFSYSQRVPFREIVGDASECRQVADRKHGCVNYSLVVAPSVVN